MGSYRFTKNEVFSLSGFKGLTIHAVDGVVWITEEGLHADILLEPGQSHTLSRRSLIVGEALTPSEIYFTGPERKRFALPNFVATNRMRRGLFCSEEPSSVIARSRGTL